MEQDEKKSSVVAELWAVRYGISLSISLMLRLGTWIRIRIFN